MISSNTFWLICVIAGCLADEAREKRIQEKARSLVQEEKFEITELPLHSQSERNHSSCPGVTETVSLYRSVRPSPYLSLLTISHLLTRLEVEVPRAGSYFSHSR